MKRKTAKSSEFNEELKCLEMRNICSVEKPKNMRSDAQNSTQISPEQWNFICVSKFGIMQKKKPVRERRKIFPLSGF